MKYIPALGLVLVVSGWIGSTPAMALPTHIKRCVMDTATDVRNASSVRDLHNKLAPRIHEHILGSRAFMVDWPTITQRNLGKEAVRIYVRKLFNLAIKKSAAHTNKQKTVTIIGIDKTGTTWSSRQSSREKLTTYFVRVAVKIEGEAPTVVIVMAINDGGRCRFGDIALLEGSSESWFSGYVDATELDLRK